jgi:hypothetical protein
MSVYIRLNETDYYPRSKYAPPLNPAYGDRKTNINTQLAEVVAFSPTSLTARYWIGDARAVLDNPLWDEGELFAGAGEELSRLSREVRRGR